MQEADWKGRAYSGGSQALACLVVGAKLRNMTLGTGPWGPRGLCACAGVRAVSDPELSDSVFS